MDDEVVLSKTAKGDEEIQSRAHGLSAKLRPVLILVDGQSSVADIVEKAGGMPEVRESLDALVAQGFVHGAGATPGGGNGNFNDLKLKLIELASDVLGKNAEKVIAKLENAPNNKEGIVAAADSCKKYVKLFIDEKKADELMEKCSTIIDEHT